MDIPALGVASRRGQALGQGLAEAGPGHVTREAAVLVMASEGSKASQPRWFTPLRLLVIFCFTNLIVYLDRGAFWGRLPLGPR